MTKKNESFEEYLNEAKKAAKFNDEHAHAHVWNHMTSKGIAHDKKAMHAELDKAKTDTSHPLHTSNLKSGWVGKNKDKDHNHAHNELKTAVHTVHNMMQHDDFKKSAKAGHKMTVAGATSGETSPRWKRFGAHKSGATSKADLHVGPHKISLKKSGGSQLASGGPEETNALHHKAATEMLKTHKGTAREKASIRKEIMHHSKKAGEALNKMRTATSQDEKRKHRDTAQKHLDTIHNKHPELNKHVRKEATTGAGKFGSGSKASASHLIKTGEKGSVQHVSHVDYSGKKPRAALPKGKGRSGNVKLDESLQEGPYLSGPTVTPSAKKDAPFTGTIRSKKDIKEKTLTAAEKRKREEVAQAIKRDNPDMPMDKKMAIATSVAKKTAEEVEVDEALTYKQRIQRKMIMRRHRPKMIMRKRMLAKRKAPEKNIAQRARKAAIRAIRKRVAGKKGQQYHKLTPQEKIMVDQRVAKKQAIVNRIAKRMLPVMRKAELVRLKSRQTKVNEVFVEYMNLMEMPTPQSADLARKNNPTLANKTKHEYTEKSSKSNIKKNKAVPTVEETVFKFVDSIMCNDYVLSEKEVRKLTEKAVEYNVPYTILKEVYDQGIQEWDESGKHTPQQVAWNKLNAFLARPDLVEYVLDYGTPEATAFWKKATPGESGDGYRPEKEIAEISAKTASEYSTKASDARGYRKLSTKKVDNRYSGVALAQDKLAKAGKLGTTAKKVSKAKVGVSEDDQFENYQSMGSGATTNAGQTDAKVIQPKKKKTVKENAPADHNTDMQSAAEKKDEKGKKVGNIKLHMNPEVKQVKEGVVGKAVLGGAIGAVTGGPVGAALGAAGGAAHGIRDKMKKRRKEKALDRLVKRQEAEKNDTQNEGLAGGTIGGAVAGAVGADMGTGYDIGSHIGDHAGKYAAGAAGLYAAKKIRDKIQQRRREKAVDKLVKDHEAAHKANNEKKVSEMAAPLPTKKQSDTMAKIKQRIVTKKIKQSMNEEEDHHATVEYEKGPMGPERQTKTVKIPLKKVDTDKGFSRTPESTRKEVHGHEIHKQHKADGWRINKMSYKNKPKYYSKDGGRPFARYEEKDPS